MATAASDDMKLTLSVTVFLAFCGTVWGAGVMYQGLRSDVAANALAIAGKADKADIQMLGATVTRLEAAASRFEAGLHELELRAARQEGAR